MGTPNVTDNYRGYEDSDLSKKAMTLDKKLLMLIHGSADETVHYQHSMMLIRALTEKGILFRHQVRCFFYLLSYEMQGLTSEVKNLSQIIYTYIYLYS